MKYYKNMIEKRYILRCGLKGIDKILTFQDDFSGRNFRASNAEDRADNGVAKNILLEELRQHL